VRVTRGGPARRYCDDLSSYSRSRVSRSVRTRYSVLSPPTRDILRVVKLTEGQVLVCRMGGQPLVKDEAGYDVAWLERLSLALLRITAVFNVR